MTLTHFDLLPGFCQDRGLCAYLGFPIDADVLLFGAIALITATLYRRSDEAAAKGAATVLGILLLVSMRPSLFALLRGVGCRDFEGVCRGLGVAIDGPSLLLGSLVASAVAVALYRLRRTTLAVCLVPATLLMLGALLRAGQ